jgi:thioredoxin 1
MVKIFRGQELLKQIETNETLVIHAWGLRCHSCAALAPILEELSTVYPNIIFGKINYQKTTSTMEKLGIRSVPTVLIFKEGKELFRLADKSMTKTMLKEALDHYC